MTFDDYRYLLKKARDLLRENINPSQVNVCAIAEALVWADGRLGDEVAANDKLDAELAALKEKYRWRDAEKEPAPKLADDRTRFVLVHERQYETMTTAQYFYEEKSWYDFGGESVDVDYWRPLEFPENPDVHAE